MKTYMAIIASIMMLATNGFGKGAITAPVGVEKVVAYVSPADDGMQVTGMVQDRHKMPSSMQASATPSAGVVLTVGRDGGAMRGSWSGRSNWGHNFNARHFDHRSFHGHHFRHGDFDRHHFRGHGYYPYRGYGYYPYYYHPYRYNYPYYYPYSYNYPYYYPYRYYYGNPGYSYPYPYSYFYFSW